MDSIEDQSIDTDPISELTVNFSETAQLLFAAGSVIDTLAQVVETAVATVEGCDFAGLFLVEKDVITTPVRTDPIVEEVDLLQQQLGEGPCLDAVSQQLIFYVDDLGDDARWPHFGPQATAAGI